MDLGITEDDIKRKQAQQELRELIRWMTEEEDKIYAELNAKGIVRTGLDGDPTPFLPLRADCERRLHELRKKYGYE